MKRKDFNKFWHYVKVFNRMQQKNLDPPIGRLMARTLWFIGEQPKVHLDRGLFFAIHEKALRASVRG